MRCTQSQFEIMLDYMEIHGDLSKISPYPEGRVQNNKKWAELVGILARQGAPKPVDKWRRAWSDLKNKTKNKVQRLQICGKKRVALNNVEQRVLKLIGFEYDPILNEPPNENDKDDDDNDNMVKIEVSRLSDSSYGFSAAKPKTKTKARKKSSSDSEDSSCCSSSSEVPLKRKKRVIELDDSIRHITDKFMEFQKERELMIHEREMARIRQNEQFLHVFGRIATVIESLSPGIQRFLDKTNNEDG